VAVTLGDLCHDRVPGFEVPTPKEVAMVDLKPGVPVKGLLDQITRQRQELSNSDAALNASDGRQKFLVVVEALEQTCTHHFEGTEWHEHLYTPSYWAVRDMTPGTTRPMPLLRSASARILRWLDDIESELTRISSQDEWDDTSIPRLVLDTSTLVREGEFDTFDWSAIAGGSRVRLIIPILVIRELDNLKNSRKDPEARKARRRLRGIYELLDGHGRGPARIREGVTIELLMNPQRHVPAAINDEEIIERAR
jgi:rRNA-processing protein FCF1